MKLCSLCARAFSLFSLMLGLAFVAHAARADDPWLTVKGGAGPGQGKHIVLVSGDEEYRSEELLPQLAKILAKEHGFDCTVLFAIDPATGEINPNELKNIPGLEALKSADLLILLTRFRDLPDEQMQHFVDYLNSGKPIIGLRTATHAFKMKSDEKFGKFSYDSKTAGFEQGFGKQVLGETWVNHHGRHKVESTRALIAPGMESNLILRGIASGEIWVPTDVYGVHLPLSSDCQPLLMGQVQDGMTPDAKPVVARNDKGKTTPNDPMMPVAWTKTFTSPDAGPGAKPARIFTTTMGSAQDMSSEGFRRLLVNATYWCLGMEDKIPAKNAADLVGDYQPSPFSPNLFKKGMKPADLK
jgi:Trehalose utilisation